jgi:hypothetical protein
MLKKLMMTTAVSGLMVTGAIAQVTNSPMTNPSVTPPPIAASPGANSPQTAPMPTAAKFVVMQGAEQWVFSKFKGTDVLGPDNAHIGDVSDLLFDKNGRVAGVIVGVGGFLGIGEKYVAIDLSAFQVVPADINSTAATRTDDPTAIKLRVALTKDQLKQAPDLQYYKSSATIGQGTPVAR